VATRKQRRRREKERRHEYEVVYVDDQGQEVEVDEAEAKAKAKKADERKQPASTNASRGGRTIAPPSWNKVGRRTLLFAPFIVIFFYITRSNGESAVGPIVRSLPLIVLLVPFMYAVDSMAYRSYQKRQDKRGGSSPKPK
jgi:hypothetical protein